ncbi:isocitrate/isopropylmalate dehydrogenase family protein [Rhodobacteraceae bacterium RKSG542]|uniref:isocitrate/isopropylmalate dehydrogenase family protein n=1 Tax=Pseudovibrio flavus TaxID=2529854 RepID=UPI0012BC7B58|nr:isocitrate/isopropylmalate dehydrogenase family protein [Pseudovibrio flavus]MTI18103.1 isocitrate/isopropylmalate dehydrogenase family protein [Pseudovibrio flavus]
MQDLKLLVLEGDGIGPEITRSTIDVISAVAPVMERRPTFEAMDIGFSALAKCGSTIPQDAVIAAKRADGVVLGPVSHNDYPPAEQGGLNPSGTLRKELELYANIRPAFTWDGLEAPAQCPFDLVVVRENLEGFYADRNMFQGGGEFLPEPGVALALRKITRKGSLRIARSGFELAQKLGKKNVTVIHKANVMRLSDGLFLECVREVAADYPQIELEELIVDAAAAHLVRNPARFDILITTNMFGDILSDLASELAGGLGLAGSLNVGDRFAVAQAQHGSAPDIAGLDTANPVSLILSAEMLLRHLKEDRAADAIADGVKEVLKHPATRTRDLGGQLGTQAFTQNLIAVIERGLK